MTGLMLKFTEDTGDWLGAIPGGLQLRADLGMFGSAVLGGMCTPLKAAEY